MSTDRWRHGGVTVTTYAGPGQPGDQERMRLLIHTDTESIALTMREWRSLVRYMRAVGNEPMAYEWIDRAYDSGLVRDGIMTLIELRNTPLE